LFLSSKPEMVMRAVLELSFLALNSFPVQPGPLFFLSDRPYHGADSFHGRHRPQKSLHPFSSSCIYVFTKKVDLRPFFVADSRTPSPTWQASFSLDLSHTEPNSERAHSPPPRMYVCPPPPRGPSEPSTLPSMLFLSPLAHHHRQPSPTWFFFFSLAAHLQ